MNRRWFNRGVLGLSSLMVAALAVASPLLQDEEKIEESLKIFNRAKLLHQEANYQEAIEEYQRAVRLDDENPWIFNFLGLAQMAIGEFKPAIKSLRKALELNPDITDIHNNLGVAYSEMGDREKAFEEFSTVIRDPSYPTLEKPLYNLGNLYFRDGNFELAVMHYRRAVERNPSFAMGYRGLGKVHMALGELELAIDQFQMALEHTPSDQESHYELGRIFESQGDVEKAREHYRNAVGTDRFSVLGRLSMARLEALKPSNEP